MEAASFALSAMSAIAAVIFASSSYPALAMVFALIAVFAAGYAVKRVNDLGRIVEGRADDQRREIDDG